MTNQTPRHSSGAMTMKDFCQWAGIGRTTAYEQVSAGKLTVRKVGRRSLVLFEDASRWLNALPTQDDQLEERLSNEFMNGGAHDKSL